MSVFPKLFRAHSRGNAEPGSKARRPHKGSFNQLFAHVKSIGFEPKTVIDVGIAEGTEGLYTSFPNAHFIMVEPLCEYLHVLQRLSKQYNAEYVQAAVGPEPGTIQILIDEEHRSTASIIKVWDGKGTRGNAKLEKGSNRLRDVPMIALDDLLKTHSIEAPILLKLDIQGAELLALEGARDLLPRCDLVVLETSLYRFGGRSPELHVVVEFMKERNFVVYDIIGGSYRQLDAALGQVDLVFVQENGRFRQSHKW